MDAAVAYLEPWRWVARDKAKKRKPFTLSHATYPGALVLAARQLGFVNEHGEALIALVEVEVWIEGRTPFSATPASAKAAAA